MVTKATYLSRNELKEIYPKFRDVKFFDIHTKHFLYGRIDRQGNAVQLNDGCLVDSSLGGKTEFMIDFVKDAFMFLKNEIDRLLKGSYVASKSKFSPASLEIHKAWRSGDLEYSYYHHLNSLYTNFVQDYLEIERRYEQIVDFDSFLVVFSKYLARVAYRFPLTKTGYILSHHCSPYVSGLMLAVAEDKHGISFDRVKEEYINDPNFQTFLEAAKRVGFMMDRNAPWRLVFNIASGGTKFVQPSAKMTFDEDGMSQGLTGGNTAEEVATGGAFFMNQYGVNFDNIFDAYYTRTHLNEIENLRNYMFLFYSAFYNQFSTFTKLETYRCQTALEFNTRLRIKYINREALPGLYPDSTEEAGVEIPSAFNKVYRDEFWLGYILKFRLLETKKQHDNKSFLLHKREMTNRFRVFGVEAALNYINDLTKGFFETKFISEGKYWYGTHHEKFQSLKKESRENALLADDDYALTGVLNEVEVE